MISTILDVSMNSTGVCQVQSILFQTLLEDRHFPHDGTRCSSVIFLRPQTHVRLVLELDGLKWRTHLIRPSITRRLRHFALLFVLHIYHRFFWFGYGIWATLLSVFFRVDCKQSLIFLCKVARRVTHARLSLIVTSLFVIVLAEITTERISRQKADCRQSN